MISTLLDNRYQIIRVLGNGGFGETFLAEDTKMPSSRYCVIKQLRAIADNPKVYQLVQQRFLREAAVLEELGETCSQIPSLYANFTENEQFYLVQEWIEGQTLLEKVKSEGRQSEDFTRQTLIDVLHILDYVHSCGMIHRDIKPDNIILRDSDRQPVLIDFGAVKETVGGGAIPHTTKSIIIGTPGFMSSEQSMGRPTFASDLYGLGMTGIYLLTGKMPRDLTTDPETAEIVWREHAPDTSESLARILEKAVQFYPRDRYANAKTMLSDLENASEPGFVPLPSQVATEAIPIARNSQNSGVPQRQLTPKLLVAQGASNSVSTGVRRSKQKIAIAAFLGSGILSGVGVAIGLPFLRTLQTSNSIAQQNPAVKPVQPTVVKPDSFYFLADSAYADENSAKRHVETLRADGFDRSGIFKLAAYPNLKQGKAITQVYVAKFQNQSSCVEQLKLYATRHPNAYCALASSDPSKPIEKVAGSSVLPPKPEPRSVAAQTNTSPEQAVREYYDLINRQNYAIAWEKLSPGFQQARAKNGFKDSYLTWWDEIERVEVSHASLVSRGADLAKVNAELTYYKKNGDIIPESLQVFLRWDTSHGWLFDDMRVR
jgi:serine/threonine protein kinase, bacterial